MPTKKKQEVSKATNTKAALKWAAEGITGKAIIMISCLVLGAILTVIIISVYGFSVGRKNGLSWLGVQEPNSSNVSIINVDYGIENFAFQDIECLNGNDNGQCLLMTYGAKDSNYAVIRSADQLNRLMSILNNVSGQEFSSSVSPDFFKSGSVIALVNETKTTSFDLTSIYRDENYNLHLQTKSQYAEGGDVDKAHLILVAVPNIQPDEVSVINTEN